MPPNYPKTMISHKATKALLVWLSPLPILDLQRRVGREDFACDPNLSLLTYSFSAADALGLAPARAARKRSRRAALAAAQLFC
jgi:hypothetical protein